MTGTKVCNKCGKKNLGWDYDFNKKTQKWKLENHKTMEGKWCNKPKEESKIAKTGKKDYVHCDKCEGQYGWLLTEEAHNRYPALTYYTQEEHDKIRHTA